MRAAKTEKIEGLAPRVVVEWLISDLTPYDGNSRTHSAEQVDQLAASIVEFGFTNPVLIDPEGGVIAGHGRIEAARQLGFDRVPCLVLEGLSEVQKRAYVIADNRLALNAGWDEAALTSELLELDDAGFDLSLTGFDETDLARLLQGEVLPILGDDEGGGASGVASRILKIEDVSVRMTDDEAAALKTMLDDYATRTGSLYGFAGWLAEAAERGKL